MVLTPPAHPDPARPPDLLAHDLDYLSHDAYVTLNEQIAEVKRMLYRFMQSLNLRRALKKQLVQVVEIAPAASPADGP